MKVLIVNTFDTVGGASRAAYRLHHALLLSGVESSMLVANKVSDDFTVLEPNSSACKLLHGFVPQFSKVLSKIGKTQSTGLNLIPTGFHTYINESDADVVNLHWINRDLMSIKEISKINKPIVWTLHDMWSFCATEGYAKDGDERYISGYKSTKNLFSLDIDSLVWEKKCRYWGKKNIHIVTPSNWLGNCAKKSRVWNENSVSVVPNALNLDTFRPIDKNLARDILNLPKNKKLVLFGSLLSTSDKRKGFDLLKESLDYLVQNNLVNDLEFVIFGASKPKSEVGSQVFHYLGKVSDDVTLALIYSAADLFVAPSMQENLANTVVEAMSCGLPIVAYDIGGMPDLVKNHENGYLATAFDTREFSDCIARILNNNMLQKQMSDQSREIAKKLFNSDSVVNQYLDVYQKAIAS